MKLHGTNSQIFLPTNELPQSDALARTTHLGIGAHPDDLEFMAYHGIAACFDDLTHWFTGVTCTNGAGSVRTGPFARFSPEELAEIRAQEQNEASRIGQYSAMLQLGYSSRELRNPTGAAALEDDIFAILEATTPDIVYTHNPADKHPTHIATLLPAIRALRRLPAPQRPRIIYGCEVWRDLDWLPDDAKVPLNVAQHPELAEKLTAVFASQIDSGKRYDLAVPGRRYANATFSNPHTEDDATAVTLALDLTPLLDDAHLSLTDFIDDHIQSFRQQVIQNLQNQNTHH